MPTRPGFDLVSVRKETKERLARLKGAGTYDDVIRRLLDGARADPAPRSKPRAPDEQVALAELAARRWRMAVDAGRIVERGPRLFVYRIGKPKRGDLRVTWTGQRGFAP